MKEKKWTIVYDTVNRNRIKFELKMQTIEQAVAYTKDVLGEEFWTTLTLHKCYGKEMG